VLLNALSHNFLQQSFKVSDLVKEEKARQCHQDTGTAFQVMLICMRGSLWPSVKPAKHCDLNVLTWFHQMKLIHILMMLLPVSVGMFSVEGHKKQTLFSSCAHDLAVMKLAVLQDREEPTRGEFIWKYVENAGHLFKFHQSSEAIRITSVFILAVGVMSILNNCSMFFLFDCFPFKHNELK